MKMLIINNNKIKIYLYLNKNSIYINDSSKIQSSQSFINVVGVQNAGEMLL